MNSTLVNFYPLTLLLPLWLFIHVDVGASNASKAQAQMSLAVEAFLVCIPPLFPLVKKNVWKEADVKYVLWLRLYDT